MGMSAGGGKGGIKSEINVTPLVDVVLVLLIIFMVVTPMLQRGKDVKLPRAKQTDAEKKDADPLVLSVTPDKKIYLEADAFDEPSLEAALKGRLEAAPGRKILLKGDELLSVGDVRKVMEIARKAGAKGVSLGVEELKEGK
jgi:biopolymer transport protein TolR